MAVTYEQAVVALHRLPLESFVAERKRLSAELKSSGDKEGAARLAKIARPSLSAWVVNQLFVRSDALFAELLTLAARVGGGDRAATVRHREVMRDLRAAASELLASAGHAASEVTLRRVMTNLSALAASGGFVPDLPGALTGDREPPGFEAMELAFSPAAPAPVGAASAEGSAKGAPALRARGLPAELGRAQPPSPPLGSQVFQISEAKSRREQRATDERAEEQRAEQKRAEEKWAEQKRAEEKRAEEKRAEEKRAEEKRAEEKRAEEKRAAERAERARVEQERRLAEQARAKRRAQRRALEGELRVQRRTLEQHQSEVVRLRAELTSAEQALAESRAAVVDSESRLAELES